MAARYPLRTRMTATVTFGPTDDDSESSEEDRPTSPRPAATATPTAHLPVAATRRRSPPVVPRNIRFPPSTQQPTSARLNIGRRGKRPATRMATDFPLARIRRGLVGATHLRVSKTAPAVMSAVAGYLTAEILDGAVNAAQQDGRKIIKAKDIRASLHGDAEMNELLADVILGGMDDKKKRHRRNPA